MDLRLSLLFLDLSPSWIADWVGKEADDEEDKTDENEDEDDDGDENTVFWLDGEGVSNFGKPWWNFSVDWRFKLKI